MSSPQHKSTLSQYSNLKKIGQGLTSMVYIGYNKQNKLVCLKIINSQFYLKSIGKLLIDNQVKILQQLQHQNLLKLIKYQQNFQNNKNENVIVTDYCDGGNLYDMIKKYKKIEEKQMVRIMNGIINGMKYLIDKNIVHRDLKPENVFFKQNQPIIADFGFAVHKDNKELNKVNAGSPLYMAPQALKSLEFSKQSDVFSLGVIMYEMLKGKTPWSAGSQKQLIENIFKQKSEISLQNKQLQKIILKCLQPNKDQRAKFQQVYDIICKQHSKYQSNNNKNNKNNKNNNTHHKKVPTQSLLLKDITNSPHKSVKKCDSSLPSKQQNCLYKIPKLSIKKQNKQNNMKMNMKLNLSTYESSVNKTNRVLGSQGNNNNNKSFDGMDGVKTKRNNNSNNNNSNNSNNSNNDKNSNNSINNSNTIDKLTNMSQKQYQFFSILTRLDPQQMSFLPSSMISKFKLILDCYVKIFLTTKPPTSSSVCSTFSNLAIHVPIILKDDKKILQILNYVQMGILEGCIDWRRIIK